MLEHLATALTNKFLHAPVSALHQTAAADDAARDRLIATLSRFYTSASDH